MLEMLRWAALRGRLMFEVFCKCRNARTLYRQICSNLLHCSNQQKGKGEEKKSLTTDYENKREK